jgi:hypothetical protein
MTYERDIERLLDTWFRDGPTEAPDRIVDAVTDRIGRQGQRPAWRLLPWRFPKMSTPIKLVAVGAALLVGLVGGALFLGGGAAPSPSPSLSPSPTPTLAASPFECEDGLPGCAGMLTGGPHRSRIGR